MPGGSSMPNWAPTVLPQAAPRASYDALFQALNGAADSYGQAKQQRQAFDYRKKRDAMADARTSAEMDAADVRDAEAAAQRTIDNERTKRLDAANALTQELSRQNTAQEMNFRAADRGFVDAGDTAAARTSNFGQSVAPANGAAMQGANALASALDGAQRTQPQMRVPDAANPQAMRSLVLDPTKTPEARAEATAQRELERTLAFAPKQAAAMRQATIGVDRANRTGDFKPIERAPQLVQTESGFMTVDPQTGQARPIMSNGQPVKGAPRPTNATQVPTSMVDATSTNYDLLTSIDDALDALDEGGGKGHLGAKRYFMPNILTQHTDPKGNDIRGLIAGIGNKQYKNMSGSAVSLAEDKRMQPDLPRVDDTPEAAKAKLERLRNSIAREDGMIRQYYAPENGYRGLPPARPARTPKTTTAAPSGFPDYETWKRSRGGAP